MKETDILCSCCFLLCFCFNLINCLSSFQNSLRNASKFRVFVHHTPCTRKCWSRCGSAGYRGPTMDDDDECIVLVEPLPPKAFWECPVCFGPFKEPCVLSCGHTFCRSCCQHEVKCPLDRVPFTSLIPNRIVADVISNLKIRCRYGCERNRNGDWSVVSSGWHVHLDSIGWQWMRDLAVLRWLHWATARCTRGPAYSPRLSAPMTLIAPIRLGLPAAR